MTNMVLETNLNTSSETKSAADKTSTTSIGIEACEINNMNTKK